MAVALRSARRSDTAAGCPARGRAAPASQRVSRDELVDCVTSTCSSCAANWPASGSRAAPPASAESLSARRRRRRERDIDFAAHGRPGMPHALRSRRGRAADRRALAGVGAVPSRARGHGGRRTTRSRSRRRTSPGALHMGHALNGSIQDALDPLPPDARQARRSGSSAPTTPASPPRRRSSARSSEGTSREEIGREAFVERVWEWRRSTAATIIEQFKRLGASCDYDDERFTLDEAYVAAVHEGLRRPLRARASSTATATWSTGTRACARRSPTSRSRSARSPTRSTRSPTRSSGDGEVVVATVRPETMLADTAIAVHPDDERYRDLIGGDGELPLVGRKLPIIADDYVKPEFGTGALKITPGHDPNDFEIGRQPRPRRDHRHRRGRAHHRRAPATLRRARGAGGARACGRRPARARA